MRRLVVSLLVFVLAGINSHFAVAKTGMNRLDWQSAHTLTNEIEKQKIQAELDEYSCTGVPTKSQNVPPKGISSGMDDLENRICKEAKVARIANEGINTLLILQFGSTGSCGDFYDAFFIETDHGTKVEKLATGHLKFVCAGGAYETGRTNAGEIITVPGGIERPADNPDGRDDLKLFWNGTELEDISKPFRRD